MFSNFTCSGIQNKVENNEDFIYERKYENIKI